MKQEQRWQDWTNLLLGAGLVLAPFFGIGALNDVAAWNFYISGTAVAPDGLRTLEDALGVSVTPR